MVGRDHLPHLPRLIPAIFLNQKLIPAMGHIIPSQLINLAYFPSSNQVTGHPCKTHMNESSFSSSFLFVFSLIFLSYFPSCLLAGPSLDFGAKLCDTYLAKIW